MYTTTTTYTARVIIRCTAYERIKCIVIVTVAAQRWPFIVNFVRIRIIITVCTRTAPSCVCGKLVFRLRRGKTDWICVPGDDRRGMRVLYGCYAYTGVTRPVVVGKIVFLRPREYNNISSVRTVIVVIVIITIIANGNLISLYYNVQTYCAQVHVASAGLLRNFCLRELTDSFH